MFKSYYIKWFFILVSILIITSSLFIYPGNFKEIGWKDIVSYALPIYTILIACWLINGYFVLYESYKFTNYARYFSGNVLAIILACLLDYLFYSFLPPTFLVKGGVGYDTPAHIIRHLVGAFIVSILCYVVFYSIHTNTVLKISKQQNEVLEQASLRAQLLSLQQQISPHFLFNSLSALKGITNEQPAKNFIAQLSSVYRTVLDFNENDLTPVKNELAFIQSYLYILEQRFEEALLVTIDVPDSYSELLIPSLSLQLLVENAIKHNIISPEQPLHIFIIANNSPALIVSNNFQPKKISEDGTGIGIKNISERYKILVNKPISVVEESGIFSVTLPLLKDESSNNRRRIKNS